MSDENNFDIVDCHRRRAGRLCMRLARRPIGHESGMYRQARRTGRHVFECRLYSLKSTLARV